MSIYQPAQINDGDNFDPTVVRDNFDKLSEAINCDLDEGNLLQSQGGRHLEKQSFHKDAVSSVFTHSSSDTAVFLFFPLGGVPYGASTNEYDVDDCALRFYLHQTANLFFFANIQLTDGMHNWKTLDGVSYDGDASVSDLTFKLWSAMYFDGAKQHHQNTTPIEDQTSMRSLNDFGIVEDGSTVTGANDGGGTSFFLHGTRLGVPAGAHTLKAKLIYDLTGQVYNPSPKIDDDACASQYYSSYRSITVIATYVPKRL